MAESVETLAGGPANANQAVGSGREGEKKEVHFEILAHQEKSDLSEK